MDSEQTQIIKDIIKEYNNEALFLEEEFDIALIGTGKAFGKNSVAVYDTDMCINILVKKYDMDELEALEHFQKNIEETEEGKNKPIFINDFRRIKKVSFDESMDFSDIYLSDFLKKKTKGKD